jgi:2-oxo-4-hydroxy-4-carboxy--5-ureidoimidazoline (OHCU) decarboxylase
VHARRVCAHSAAQRRLQRQRFGFPFILAVRGPRGTGLSKQQIIDTFARRLDNHPDFELPRPCATSTALPRFA